MRYAAENPGDVTPQLLEKLLRHSGGTKSTSGKKHGKRPDKNDTSHTALDRDLLLAIAMRSSSVQVRQKDFSLLSEPDNINRFAKEVFPERNTTSITILTRPV
jgi:hypothetical protein